MDHVLHTIAAGMGYPLPTGHKLPFHVFPEGVTHTAMAARQTHACPYCLTHVAPLLMGDPTHGPAGHEEIEGGKPFKVFQTFQVILDVNFPVALFQKHVGKTLTGELRLVSVPTALYNQCLSNSFRHCFIFTP